MSKPGTGPVVLIADDQPDVLEYLDDALSRAHIPTVSAMSLNELYAAFKKHRDEIVLIILDGCIPGNTLNTLEFIQMARSDGFTEPIIAASSFWEYRQQMRQAGCSHTAEKIQAPGLAIELLTGVH